MPNATRTRSAYHTPTEFDLDEVCDRIADGESLRNIAADSLVSAPTLLKWLSSEPERRARYDQARLDRAHRFVDEIVELSDVSIGDPINTAARRLQIDTRKWVAGKLYPRVYGDKLQTEITGKNGGPVQIEASQALRIAQEVLQIATGAAPKASDDV